MANKVVSFLNKKGIDARSKFPSRFNSNDRSESDGWGVMVEPKDVKDSARELGPYSKSLQFDPFVKIAGYKNN